MVCTLMVIETTYRYAIESRGCGASDQSILRIDVVLAELLWLIKTFIFQLPPLLVSELSASTTGQEASQAAAGDLKPATSFRRCPFQEGQTTVLLNTGSSNNLNESPSHPEFDDGGNLMQYVLTSVAIISTADRAFSAGPSTASTHWPQTQFLPKVAISFSGTVSGGLSQG
jgi:hypothetical protein